MYTVSSSTKEKVCKIPKGKIHRFLPKWKSPFELAKDCKELADSMYPPLYRYLVQKLDDPKKNERIPLLFSKIEEILGKPLPKEARTHDTWWANDETNVQAKAWRLAGWKTLSPDFSSEKITFVREASLLKFLESRICKILLLNRYRIK